MDFQSAMETFAEAWVAANAGQQVTEFLSKKNLPVKALLLINNAPSHPSELELKTEDGNIIAMFFPPNVTPLIQPMDQNAIKITKLYYRTSLLAMMAAKNSDLVSSMKTVTLKDAVTFLEIAWNKVSTDTMAKCWKNLLSFTESEEDPEENVPLSILKANMDSELQLLMTRAVDVLNELNPLSQALALTRVANAAAAAAAANANANVNAKQQPSESLHPDVIVKTEHSLSPPPPLPPPPPQQPALTLASSLGHHGGARQSPTNTNAQTSSNANDESPSEASRLQQHRRPSLQGVQDKLQQLQQMQQQQQLQQQQNDVQRSPHYTSGNLSTHNTTPSPSSHRDLTSTPIGHNPTTLASSQNSSTPKLNDRDDHHILAHHGSSAQHQQQQQQQQRPDTHHAQRVMGSITCLPPSALNAVAAAAAAQHQHQQQHQHQVLHQAQQQHQSSAEKLLSSPAGPMEQRKDFDVTKVNSKSLPLHCVVESVHSLQASLTIDQRSPWKRRPNVETDSYVIVAATTPWSEIVQTALQRLGYSQETSSTARGSLIIKNWKPIPLEHISDNPVVPVCDIIGELTSVVTLRIVILRCKPSPFGEIKDKLLKLLVLQSHAVLRSTGCPLDEVTLSQICRSSYQNPFAFPGGDIPEDLRRKFDQWWSNQLSPQATMAPKLLPFMAAPPGAGVNSEMEHNMGTAALAAAAAAAAAAHAASAVGSNVPASISASRESLLLNDSNSHHAAGVLPGTPTSHHANMMVHPAMHASMHHHASLTHSQFSNQKTRMRTSFDPEMELPRLQKWFQENPHPSRQQIQAYVVQLNALESRRGRKPLDVNNVVYWFKNARAAQKRAEMRGGFGAMQAAMNGYLGQHSQLGQTSGGSSTGSMSSQQQMIGSSMGNLSLSNDFMKSPLSLKSEDIDTMSQHSDDMDDEQSRPNSPQLPLSLTIHERHQTTPEVDNKDLHSDNRNSTLNDTDDKVDSLNESQNERSQSRSYEDREKFDANNKEKAANDDVNASEAAAHNDDDHRESETNNNSSNSLNNNQSLDNSHNASRPSSPKHSSSKEDDEDLDMDEDDDDNDVSHLDDFRSPSPDMNNAMVAAAAAQRKDLPFPMVPNNMFSQSFMYMSHYMPGFGQAAAAAAHPHAAAAHHAAAAAAAHGMQPNPLMAGGGLNLSNISSEERRKRNRTFIDPVTEVPKLEQWFAMNTHPSHSLILKYTEDLNTMPYRQKFPRLESKNVQFWFKNRRAKCKRLKMSLYDTNQCSQLTGLNSFVHKYDERD